LQGLTASLLNSIIMIQGSLFHFIMGAIMEYQTKTNLKQGVTALTAEHYAPAITVIPVTLFLGCVLFFMLSSYFNRKII
jgi:hypothetical protein